MTPVGVFYLLEGKFIVEEHAFARAYLARKGCGGTLITSK